jgi:hypothetical protein
MPDPPLPAGDRPRGVRGDTGGGAGARPASPQRTEPVGRTRRDPRARGWDQGRAHHRGLATITAGHGDFQRPSRPGNATHLGLSPTLEVGSGGLDGGWSHFRVPARSAGLQHRSVQLSLGWLLCPWLRVVRPIVFHSFFLSPFRATVI